MKLVTNNQHSDLDSEQISSMVDGELSSEEMREELSPLLSAGRERAQWQHYHLVRDLLQHQLPEQIDPNFTQKVMQQLENEPTVLLPIKRGRAVVKQVVSIGLAASVAAIALLSSYVLNDPNGTSDIQQTQMVADLQTTQKVQNNSKGVEQWKRAPDLDQYRTYLANHAAYSAGSRNQGFMPYARVVGYSSDK